MNSRRYKTVYFLAKAAEIFSKIIIIPGIALSVYLAFEELYFGILAFAGTLIITLILIFSSQIPLIYIDTENNTRQIAEEIKKTNAMLSETMGVIVSNLNKISSKDKP